MERLTRYDYGRGIYIIPPNAPEGVSHIQRLGMYEDRDTVKVSILPFADEIVCGVCDRVVAEDYNFCPDCGQRLKEADDGGSEES